jgi:hypothetical protein
MASSKIIADFAAGVYRLEMQSIMFVFSALFFVKYCPSNVLTGSSPPLTPPPLLETILQFTLCV